MINMQKYNTISMKDAFSTYQYLLIGNEKELEYSLEVLWIKNKSLLDIKKFWSGRS